MLWNHAPAKFSSDICHFNFSTNTIQWKSASLYPFLPSIPHFTAIIPNGYISRLIRTLLTKPSLILRLLSTLVREALLTLKVSGLKKKLENICTAFVDFPQRNVVISLDVEGSLDGLMNCVCCYNLHLVPQQLLHWMVVYI